jgi:hypothetical protein
MIDLDGEEIKEIKIMPDFCSSGIWNNITYYMLEYEDLNLPKELSKEFYDWIEFYDKCHEKFVLTNNIEEMNNKGRELAKKLKQLYPNIKIYYHGEIKNAMLEKEEILL